MGRRRIDQLPIWPAVVAGVVGVGLIALGRVLARSVDDAIAEVDYS